MSLLSVEQLDTAYGVVQVTRDVSMTVEEGEIVTIIGPNGAGKSTILRAISGLLKPRRGTISFNGRNVTGLPADRMAALGVVMVPEGRRIFGDLTVRENLRIGAYCRRDEDGIERDIAQMESYFDILAKKRDAKGSALSGGQQQMLAIARGLMARPRVLILDEPSLGLAPVMVRDVRSVIGAVRDKFGAAVLLVEQNASLALAVAERGYLLQHGKIVASGSIGELRESSLMRELYFGEQRAAAGE
ncbi:MAG: ABC transporter ATP-binding protein [Roseiarcus sp.]|uniref:ABC transporter ATP-binding protein n=1 Tax=Roseiarcus sp. TaxID=1969460 RepID=UPI003C2A199E